MAVAESHPEPHAQPRLYRCYLLRCWLEEDGEADSAPVWRFTIRQAEPDAARRAFTSPGELAAYLQAELASYALTQNDG